MGPTRLIITLACAGCMVGEPDDAIDGADGDGKGDASGTCTDKRYGDGTCQLELSCTMPDIDCFHSFDTDAAAQSWAEGAGLAIIKGTDARITHARAIVDRAWSYVRAYYSFGQLEMKPISLVVVDDPTDNAFVTAYDDGKQLTTVFVHSGILGGKYSDDALVGVVAHELGHMVKLHAYPEKAENIARYYTASTTEPLGAIQQDHATPRAAVSNWSVVAAMVGADSRAELGGLPLMGVYGGLFGVLLGERIADASDATCKTNAQRVEDMRIAMAKAYELDDSTTVKATTQADVDMMFTLLEACRAKVGTLQELANRSDTITAARISALTGADALQNMNALDALKTLTANARANLRQMMADYQKASGQPFSSIRFYSYEEMADDVSTRVTQRAKLTVMGTAAFHQIVLDTQGPACDAARAKGPVPYGIYLDDPHHGTCWRIAHAYQYGQTVRSAPVHSADDPADVIEPPTLPEGYEPTRIAPRNPIY